MLKKKPGSIKDGMLALIFSKAPDVELSQDGGTAELHMPSACLNCSTHLSLHIQIETKDEGDSQRWRGALYSLRVGLGIDRGSPYGLESFGRILARPDLGTLLNLKIAEPV